MPVTSEHIQTYREEGYCLIKNLIPEDVVEQVRVRTMEIAGDTPDWPVHHFQVIDPQRYKNPNGKAYPAGIQQPASQEKLFSDMADHPALVEAMAGLLGGKVNRFTDQIGVKHGFLTEEQGGCSYFHQDSFYWHIEPQLGCNCWIPMSEVGQGSIALAVVPGSQKGWHLIDHESYFDDPSMGHIREEYKPFKRHRIPLDQIDFSKEVLIPMQAGDGLFFTNFTWHRSEPNQTGETLAFYAIAYKLDQS